jgi:hypothetical protein
LQINEFELCSALRFATVIKAGEKEISDYVCVECSSGDDAQGLRHDGKKRTDQPDLRKSHGLERLAGHVIGDRQESSRANYLLPRANC